MGQRSLLRRRGPFRPFLFGLSLSAIGDGIATAALTLYVQETAGTGVAVGALLLTQTVPRLMGPVIGSIADRTHAIRLMIGCDIGQAVVYAAIALLLPSLGPLLAFVFVASLLSGGTSAGRGATLPTIVEQDDLLAANVLLGAGFNAQVAIGPLIGGLLFAAGGPELALALNAATFLASGLLLALVRAPRIRRKGEAAGVFAEVREASVFVWRNPVLRTLLLSMTLSIAFLSVDNVALVFLVRDTLDGGPAAYGLALSGFGVGMLLGSGAMIWRTPRAAGALYVFALVLTGSGTLLTGLAPGLLAAVLFQAIAGIGNSCENAGTDTVIQEHAPPEMLGRVFGLVGSMAYAGAGIAAAIGGPLLDLTSPRAVFVIGGVGGLLVVLFAARPPLRNESVRPA